MAQIKQTADESAEKPIDRRIKTGFSLTEDAHHRLTLAKVVEGKTGDQIVNELITSNLTGYYAGRRSAKVRGEEEVAA